MAGTEKYFSFEGKQIEQKEAEELRIHFKGIMNPCEIRYGPKGYIFPREFKEFGRDIYNMEVRPEDTFVVTFPKSGTTWTQDMVWLIANNFDYEKALEIPLNARYPFIDIAMFINPDILATMSQDKKLQQAVDAMVVLSVEQIMALPNPRFLKSHLPLSLLPPKLLDTCKVVYVARDPRDVAVSFYHHSKLMSMTRDDIEFKVYWKFFIKDLDDFCILIPWTPFFSHIKEAWELRNHPNLLFLFYEELSKDLPTCIRRVAKFLSKDISDDQVEKLCDHLNIKNFKMNKSVNLQNMHGLGILNETESFIRKGKVGGWRDYFDDEMTEEAERWIQENLRDTDLRFPQ